jgi:hypothetical protein
MKTIGENRQTRMQFMLSLPFSGIARYRLKIATTLGVLTSVVGLCASSEALAQDGILTCPITQSAVKNGARPDPEVLKKVIRCKKGEKPAQPGYDGAVGIEVTALQIGSSRKWSPSRDSGNGDLDTIVYPVKVTYTERTFYKTRTQVSENWIRILNVYVNAFGEWQVGSEEPIKSPENKSIPK